MAIIPALLTVLVLVVIHAGFAKLAARLHRRTRLPWKSAFGYGGIVVIVALVGTLVRNAVPFALVLVAVTVAAVSLGTWFLASRAKNSVGEPIGPRTSAVISAIAVGMGWILSVVVTVLPPLWQQGEA